jgi:hypothetical protein
MHMAAAREAVYLDPQSLRFLRAHIQAHIVHTIPKNALGSAMFVQMYALEIECNSHVSGLTPSYNIS